MTIPAIAPAERPLWWVSVGSPLEAPLVELLVGTAEESLGVVMAVALLIGAEVELVGSGVVIVLLEKETRNQAVMLA